MCQEPSNKPLRCPAKSLRSDIGTGYDTLGDNLKGFLELGARPVSINIARLDEGDGIGKTLARNQAKWHSSCHLKCGASRLARARTRTSSDDSEELSVDNHYMLRRTEHNMLPKDLCFSVVELEPARFLYMKQ